MKKRTSNMSRRIVSLLMSLVLALTLVTPAAFAESDMPDNGQQQEQQVPTDAGNGGSGTPIVEGGAGTTGTTPSGDAGNGGSGDVSTPADGKDSENKDDEDKDTEDANKPAEDNKGEENPAEDKKDEDNKDEQNTEDENDGEDEIALLNDENGSDVWDGKPAEKFAGGAGTVDDPYKISTGAELAYLAEKVNGGESYSGNYFKLTSDIRLNADDVPTGGDSLNSWKPIGDKSNHFQGTFDGDGHTISGLYIDFTGTYKSKNAGKVYQGLFGYVEGGTVQNLIVTGSVAVKNELNKNVSCIGGIVGYTDGTVQNCGFYGTISAKKNVLESPTDCSTTNNGGVVGNGEATNCWYFCTDIENASLLGVLGSYNDIDCCYQNVSSDLSESDNSKFIADLNSFKAILQMNAAGTNMWKPGKVHPEFLQGSDKLVALQPLFSDKTAAVQVNGSAEGTVVTDNTPIVLTGEDVYYRVGENGEWTKIDGGSVSVDLDGADQVVTIYYASAEEFQSAEWYDPNANEFVLTTAGQLAYLAQLVNGGTSFAGKTIKLGGNIEISEKWTAPIGTEESKPFKGTFDGEGHVVSVKDGTTFCGLFGYNAGTIRNVIVTGTVDASSATDTNVGGIAGTNQRKVQNCGFYGRFENTAGKTIRGVANGAGTGVENCWFYNTGEDSVDVAGDQWNKSKNSYVNKGDVSGGELVSGDFAAVVAKKLNDALADSWFPWVTQEGCDYPVMLTEGKLVNVTSYDGADDTVVTIGDSGTASAAVTENTVTLKLADSYTGETVYIISDPAEEVVIDGENATPRLTSASRTCVYTLPDGQRFVKLYYGTVDKLNADDTWYNADAAEMTIMSAKQLRTFAGMVNAGTDFAGKTIKLGADIALSGEWMPIGTAEHPFKGTFDGRIRIIGSNYKYYAVSGLEVNGTSPYAGLFGVVDGGTVQYLTVTGSVSSEAKDAHVGGIVGWLKAKGTVETCVFTGSVKAAGENAVRGGLVGKVESTASVSDGYCYSYNSAEDVKPVGEGEYTKCFYLAAESTSGKSDDNGARTEQEFKVGRVAWELLGENKQFTDNSLTPCWAQENGMPVIASHFNYFIYEVELVKRSGPEGLFVIMQANGTNALSDGDTQRVYVREATEITIDSDGIGDDYTVTYSPKDPRNGINKYLYMGEEQQSVAPNNTFYYTVSANTNEDISWYIGNEGASTYTLETAAQLFGFAALVNGTAKDKDGKTIPSKNFNGRTINLADDIDVSGYEWIPIGYSDGYTPTAFAGTFNGDGHTVTLALDTIGKSYVGFFGYVTGTVKNLTVDGSVKADATGSRTGYAAGVVAYLAVDGTVEMCVNKASVTTNGRYTAGIVGSSSKKDGRGGVIKNCRNTGAISSTFGGGYAAGIANIAASVTQCWNEGDIELKTVKDKSTNSRVAGVATGAPVLNSANFGKVSGPTWSETGVYIGGVGTANASNSYNLGTVTGAEGKTHSISGGTVVNSYYADIAGNTGIYVKSGSDTIEADTSKITITEVDGKKVYKVGNTELVKVLNENDGSIPGALQWINKQDEPWNPVHIQRWDGRYEPGVTGTAALTYDPNGATIGRKLTETQRIEENQSVATFTIRTDGALGFKHENGTFLGWSKTPDTTELDYEFDASKGTLTPAEISVDKGETVTLYAVWQTIWDTDKKDGAYLIKTENDLKALQTQVNDKGFDYTGKWFRLWDNITLTGNWTPIGKYRAEFCGNLDGNQKSISGLNVNSDAQHAGLFGKVGKITVHSLTLRDGAVICTNGATSWCGGLAGSGSLLLNDVHIVNMTISGDGIGGTGGILGGGSASMTSCSNTGGSVSGRYAGGLVGRGNSNGTDFTFTDCNNSAAVTGRNYAGGMSGSDRSEDMKFTNCSNAGSISSGGPANGIAANGTFDTCINMGAINSSQGRASGIADYAKNITQCGNMGTVSGGIATGIARHALRIEKCYNTGRVSATAGNAAAYGIAQSVNGYIKNSFTYNVDTKVPLVSNIKGGTYGDKNEVTNSYYLASSATAVYSCGEYATLDDFASGKVAWGVDGGTGKHENYWTQGSNNYPVPIGEGTSTSYYRAKAECGTGGSVSIKSSRNFTGDTDNAVYGPKGMSVTVTATPMDNTYALKSMTVQLPVGTAAKSISNPGTFTMPNEGNVLVTANFGSATPGGGGGYYYGGSGDGTGTGDKDDEGLQDGLNMDVEYDIKGLVLGTYAEWGSNGGNKSFQKWLEENPNVVRALLTNSLDNMATAAVGKKTDEAKDLAALLLASLNEHTGVDGKDGDTIAKALQKYIDSGSEEVFSAWLTGGGGMASGTYESIYGQYASSLAALADRLYSKWEASGTSMTFPVWLDSQQVSMDSLSENADEPDTDTANDPQTSDAPDDVPDGQDTEGGASGNSVWEIIGTVVRENPILVWSIVAVIAALIIVGAVRRYHKVRRDEHDEK